MDHREARQARTAPTTESKHDSKQETFLQTLRKGLRFRLGMAASFAAALHFAAIQPRGNDLETKPASTPSADLDLSSEEGLRKLVTEHDVKVDTTADTVVLTVDGASPETGQVIELVAPQTVTMEQEVPYQFSGRKFGIVETTTDIPDEQEATQIALENAVEQSLGQISSILHSDDTGLIASVSIYGEAYRSPEGAMKANQALSERTAAHAQTWLTSKCNDMGLPNVDVEVRGIGERGSEKEIISDMEAAGYQFSSRTQKGKIHELTKMIDTLNHGGAVPDSVRPIMEAGLQRGVNLQIYVDVKGINLVVKDTPAKKLHFEEWGKAQESPTQELLRQIEQEASTPAKNTESLSQWTARHHIREVVDAAVLSPNATVKAIEVTRQQPMHPSELFRAQPLESAVAFREEQFGSSETVREQPLSETAVTAEIDRALQKHVDTALTGLQSEHPENGARVLPAIVNGALVGWQAEQLARFVNNPETTPEQLRGSFTGGHATALLKIVGETEFLIHPRVERGITQSAKLFQTLLSVDPERMRTSDAGAVEALNSDVLGTKEKLRTTYTQLAMIAREAERRQSQKRQSWPAPDFYLRTGPKVAQLAVGTSSSAEGMRVRHNKGFKQSARKHHTGKA